MGQYLFNNKKTQLRAKTSRTAYRKLLTLANSMYVKLNGNTEYPTPNPDLTTFHNHINALETAAAKLGNKRNRASHAAVLDCQNASDILKSDITSLQSYCTNTTNEAYIGAPKTAAAILATSGSSLKLKGRKTAATTGAVRNLHQSNSKKYPFSMHRIAWQRPIGLIKGKRVNSYLISLGVDAMPIQTTKTNYAFNFTPGQTGLDVTIYPISPAGQGEPAYISVR